MICPDIAIKPELFFISLRHCFAKDKTCWENCVCNLSGTALSQSRINMLQRWGWAVTKFLSFPFSLLQFKNQKQNGSKPNTFWIGIRLLDHRSKSENHLPQTRKCVVVSICVRDRMFLSSLYGSPELWFLKTRDTFHELRLLTVIENKVTWWLPLSGRISELKWLSVMSPVRSSLLPGQSVLAIGCLWSFPMPAP